MVSRKKRKLKEHASEEMRTLNQLKEKYKPFLQELQEGTQNHTVLQHILNKGSITTYEAFIDYGITRLPSRIYDLRCLGIDIDTGMTTKKSANGTITNYAKYTLKEMEEMK